MEDSSFDRALVAAAFQIAAEEGWTRVSVAEAARRAGLPLDRARARFPGRSAVLMRFGVQADQMALSEMSAEPEPRSRLFDLLMRRFDALQEHRAGILALLRALPADPGTAMLLYGLTLRSMGWMLEGAGVGAHGLRGALRTKGLLAVWLYTLRAWERDESADLSGTMAALDRALSRAEQAADWLHARGRPRNRPATEDADVSAMPPPPPAPMPPASPPPASPPPASPPDLPPAGGPDPGSLPPP